MVKYPWPASSGSAQVRRLDLICPPATLKSSTKSRLGIVLWLASSIVAVSAPVKGLERPGRLAPGTAFTEFDEFQVAQFVESQRFAWNMRKSPIHVPSGTAGWRGDHDT